MQNTAPRRMIPGTVRALFTVFNLILSPDLVNRRRSASLDSAFGPRGARLTNQVRVEYIKGGLTDGRGAF